MTGVVLEAVGLHRFFHAGDEEVVALRDVHLRVNRGEVVAVLGPSGSGKTTLLACLAGLDDPDGGTVRVAGHRLSRREQTARTRLRARHIGALLQSGNLVEHLTVRENVALARALSPEPAASPVEEVLHRLDIAHRADAYPATLSGGEAARAALAVALCNDPDVLLADEPTSEVDTQAEAAIATLLREAAASDRAVVVVTHSRRLAERADRRYDLVDGRLTSSRPQSPQPKSSRGVLR